MKAFIIFLYIWNPNTGHEQVIEEYLVNEEACHNTGHGMRELIHREEGEHISVTWECIPYDELYAPTGEVKD